MMERPRPSFANEDSEGIAKDLSRKVSVKVTRELHDTYLLLKAVLERDDALMAMTGLTGAIAGQCAVVMATALAAADVVTEAESDDNEFALLLASIAYGRRERSLEQLVDQTRAELRARRRKGT